ncbi:MAG TPA: ABC transporter ATP-binding protein, partial [Clostridiales bacterium]|nr:ABC transporter ATP-binding protein [Clostridiales bacterium]
MPGPGPRNQAPAPKVKHPMKLFLRILKYAYGHYKIQLVGVLLGIVVSSVSMVLLMTGMQSLVDDYIMPLMQEAVPDYGPLAGLMRTAVLVALAGVLGTFIYSLLNAFITQGTLKKLRVDLFSKMESLPIRYFDQNTHGDIMSVYTNDVDTLRQLISQSLPNLLSDLLTLVVTAVSMLSLSWELSLVSFFMVALMLFVSTKLSGVSGRYFLKQQKELGSVNGYIEEMMTGQKVVKLFNHEEQSKAEFAERNDSLFGAASKAQTIASIMMPINGNLGNISYVLCAIVGCVVALSGNSALTIGTLISFLTLNKSLTSPISQLSSQMNSSMMGLAGAERVFELLDQ